MMAIQKGKDVLLRIRNTDKTYSVVGGLRTRTFALNAQIVDVTHLESPGGWREILPGAGVNALSISGAGVFINDEAAQLVQENFFQGALSEWEIIVPQSMRLHGSFFISNLDFSGNHDGEATFSMTLESASYIRRESV